MIFRQFFDEDSYTYTYLLADEDSKEAILIDPVKDKTSQYLQILDELSLKLTYAIDTHVHADHVTALGSLREARQCTTVMGAETAATCVDRHVRDREHLSFGNYALKAISTPGHTDDSYSYYLETHDQGMLFTGDTLLIRGTGRTDFQNGSSSEQYNSIFNKLLAYPDETLIYPAHDYKGWTVSTVAEERAHNPRLQVKTIKEYEDIMSSLKLPNPKMMDEAVPANRACGKL